MADVTEQPAPEPVAIFKKRGNKANAAIRKRPATPPQDADSESSTDYSSQDESGGRVVKRRKKNGIAAGTSAVTASDDPNNLVVSRHAADGSAKIQDTNDATKQTRLYEESAKDAAKQKNGVVSSGTGDGNYKGSANYQSFIQKNPNRQEKSIGPMKAPSNIRTITTTDFAPDVCKDYKQTGFCGFGDSCKFLHAREDYKQGWQLDKDWEIDAKGKNKSSGTTFASANKSRGNASEAPKDEAAMLEKIPFACIICKESYKNPVVTKCGHYFCEKCALDRYRKKPACAACGADTGGVFNVAKSLQRLLERKRQREKEKKEKAREAGEEVSESEKDESE